MTDTMEYYKRPETGGLYNYYELTNDAHTVISFLSEYPAVSVFLEANNPGLNLNKSIREVGEVITREEYQEAYQRALDHPKVHIFG